MILNVNCTNTWKLHYFISSSRANSNLYRANTNPFGANSNPLGAYSLPLILETFAGLIPPHAKGIKAFSQESGKGVKSFYQCFPCIFAIFRGNSSSLNHKNGNLFWY